MHRPPSVNSGPFLYLGNTRARKLKLKMQLDIVILLVVVVNCCLGFLCFHLVAVVIVLPSDWLERPFLHQSSDWEDSL